MPVDVAPVRIHKRRILCVDDDVLGTTMRAEILKEHGFSVVVFHSPLEVTRCDLSTFNLAILDFEMPGLNGRELLLRIRARGLDSQSCCSRGASRVFRMKIASCLRGVSTRACPFITYSTRSRNISIQTGAPIMARDRGIFRRTEPRSPFKPASRVVDSVRDKRQGLPYRTRGTPSASPRQCNLSPSTWLKVRFERQSEMKCRSFPRVGRCPHTSVVRLNNRTTDRQPHTAAFWFRGKECIKNAVCLIGG